MGWPMTRALPLLIHGLLAAGIGVSAWLFAPPGMLLLTLAMGAVLLALASIDWRTFILPDPLNALLALLGLLMIWQHARADWLDHLTGAAAGYLALLGIELFYRHVRGIDALGRGDASRRPAGGWRRPSGRGGDRAGARAHRRAAVTLPAGCGTITR